MISPGEQEVAPRRRRDFEQNRESILAAADSAFVELGASVSVNQIATRAGVSPATVYRHFPNRDSLVDAVFELRVKIYAEAIEEAQADPDHRSAFRKTAHALVALQGKDRSFRELMGSQDEIPFDVPGFERFAMALLGSFERARGQRVIRADVSNEDMMLLLLATEGIARPVTTEAPDAMARLVDIALDGLCNEASELRGDSLTWEQLLRATGS